MELRNHTWKVSGVTTDYPTLSNPKKTIISTLIEDGVNRPFELEVAHVLPSVNKKINTAIIVNALDMYKALKRIAFESDIDSENYDDLKQTISFIRDISQLSIDNIEL